MASAAAEARPSRPGDMIAAYRPGRPDRSTFEGQARRAGDQRLPVEERIWIRPRPSARSTATSGARDAVARLLDRRPGALGVARELDVPLAHGSAVGTRESHRPLPVREAAGER